MGAHADDELLAATDLVLLDIKSWDPEQYHKLTGQDLQPTLDFAERWARMMDDENNIDDEGCRNGKLFSNR